MITPQRAPVKPRVYVRDSSETIPLEDAVSLLRQGPPARVALTGAWGAGKTTALAHLADHFSDDSGIVFLDDDKKRNVDALAGDRLAVFASVHAFPDWADERLQLAPWGRDELIEYLLVVHPDRCRPVMERLARADDHRSIPHLPELWQIVLDRMAADESVTSVQEAFLGELDSCLPDSKIRTLAEDYSRDSLCGDAKSASVWFYKLTEQPDRVARLMRLLGHRLFRVHLASDNLADQLTAHAPCEFLRWHLPTDLIEALAKKIAHSRKIHGRLRQFVEGPDRRFHSTTATLLHATGNGWQPSRPAGERRRKPGRRPKATPRPGRSESWIDLAAASLPSAAWPGIDLSSATLTGTDFTSADLSAADLSHTAAQGACFSQTNLAEADLTEIHASGASFTDADLSRSRMVHAKLDAANLIKADLSLANLSWAYMPTADLTQACLAGANLTQAGLPNARIDGADFSNANLTLANLSHLPIRKALFSGAQFRAATLFRADLEFMSLPNAQFEKADLTEAVMTGSIMHGACFQDADLAKAGLADVDWEGADLRHANFNGASFHMGSSRSGLVDSPLASEGTRTGFYTDDFSQQHFKAPEEIRKANLRGADLRGANVRYTDFYLVDLRGARCTDVQRDHFRRCGAILENRARDAG